MYTSTKATVFDDQHDKLKNAIAHQKSTFTKLYLDYGGDGEHTLLLTRGQIAKIEGSKMIGKHGLTLHHSKRQVKANVHHLGGFLGMVAGLAAKARTSKLGGLATGLVSAAVKRGVGGDRVYLHKLGHCV